MGKMHENELEIDEYLVNALLVSQCPHWAHLPLKAVASSGTDNALFRLGDNYVVRLPRIEWAPGSIKKNIDKENEWLPKIAPFLKKPISEPVFKGCPDKSYPWYWSVTKWNEGHNPSYEKDNEYEFLAKDLACFLNDLHGIKMANGPLSRRGIPLKELDKETIKAISELTDEIDIRTVTSLWRELSQIPSWNNEPVWLHGDFLPGNILVQNNRLAAVIDFSDVGIGDPACDLVIAWSLLDSHSRNIFKENLQYIDENTWERGRGWALSIALIMLPYYKISNPVLASLARRMIEHVLKANN
ncbi:aminoglycoside phosphotransferase family protein [Legionella cardiaca]|uniref:Aminoglycoside phosphotransferase family protein n=1 Tax=Legionella cardiaca TaxID=1071983 RepID=A0ABY8AX84_9GAMM|nr:aminoglycoside phosphotransferase family protein [Legionella cardiaca]WED44349.1 aminoglycoside phosphotransferase family protein [Legionella cardiaca]